MIFAYGKGKLGEGLIVLPDIKTKLVADSRVTGDVVYANGFELMDLMLRATDLLLLRDRRLTPVVESRFEATGTPEVSSARREFAAASWKAETDWLVKNVTVPILGQWFDLESAGVAQLGVVGKAFKVMVAAEQRANRADNWAMVAAVTAGVGAGAAQRSGDGRLAMEMLQNGTSTTDSLKVNRDAAVEISKLAGAAQSQYTFSAGQREFKVNAASWNELHKDVKEIYSTIQ
jgi:hypothetical protein